MASETSPQGSVGTELAIEIPSKYLPGIPYEDLPEPTTFRKVVGPSVILLATSIGSGEYVLWPFITSQVGLVVMWMAVVGITLQYFINMEIERYTLATGETAVTGFTRLWRPWGVVMALLALISWGWPGWATGASTALTFVLGTSTDAVPYITIAALVAIGIALTVSPVVYQAVEKIQMVLVAVIVLFIIAAVFVAIDGQTYVELGKGVVSFGQIPEGVGTATLLGALAFAGAGGTVNLVQSNWIRDKGLAMGARIPRIVSPFTGEEEAMVSTGYFFHRDEQNMRRWRGWWKLANQEQFWLFLVVGGLSILLLSALTFATIGTGSEAEDFDFVRFEGEALQEAIAPWFGQFFWITGIVVLLSTNLGVLDHMGRITADVLKVDFLRDNDNWSESRIYFVVIWAEIAFGAIVLLTVVDAPLVLLVISSSINGVVMFIYSGLLIQLNWGKLPAEIKLRSYRLVVMGLAVLFFGYFSVVTIIDQFGQLLGG
ncbi:MAG TPA: Nramp family divalent metal transporter [Euzebyales bacterium]|nr:Nramp family divalent metal transporter [Euzebyales bacterium]